MSGFLNVMLANNAAAAGAAIAFIDGVVTASSNGDSVTSGAINSTGADFLIAAISDYTAATLGVLTDSKGNSWNALTPYTDSSLPRVRLFWSVPTTVGSGHTVTFTGSGNQPTIGFAAFSNVNATPFDNEVGTSGSSASPAAGSITPSANDCLIISATSFFGAAASGSINSGFTVVGSMASRVGGLSFGFGLAYLIQTSLAGVNPTWMIDSSTSWAATNAVFKPV